VARNSRLTIVQVLGKRALRDRLRPHPVDEHLLE
jgi:hypothetical protein